MLRSWWWRYAIYNAMRSSASSTWMQSHRRYCRLVRPFYATDYWISLRSSSSGLAWYRSHWNDDIWRPYCCFTNLSPTVTLWPFFLSLFPCSYLPSSLFLESGLNPEPKTFAGILVRIDIFNPFVAVVFVDKPYVGKLWEEMWTFSTLMIVIMRR